jgi:hypothetical protein
VQAADLTEWNRTPESAASWALPVAQAQKQNAVGGGRMALNLRERFGPKSREPRMLLADDFRFLPSGYPSLRDFRIDHERVDMLEMPLAVDIQYVLSRGTDGLQLEFALCIAGFAAAVDLLFLRAGAFQREPADEALVDLPQANSIGDVGVAWRWGRDEADGVSGFVRHNVVVFMQGGYDALLQHAGALDAELERRATTTAYSDSDAPLLDGNRGEAIKLAPGGRIDLGLPVSPEARHFFVASGGAVNRDPTEPARFYYRAGLEKGTYLIRVFRVGHGLLPARQTIPVAIS